MKVAIDSSEAALHTEVIQDTSVQYYMLGKGSNGDFALISPGWLGARAKDFLKLGESIRNESKCLGEPAPTILIPLIPGLEGTPLNGRVDDKRIGDTFLELSYRLNITKYKTIVGASMGGIIALGMQDITDSLVLLGMPTSPSHINAVQLLMGRIATHEKVREFTEKNFVPIFTIAALLTTDFWLTPSEVRWDVLKSISKAYGIPVVDLLEILVRGSGVLETLARLNKRALWADGKYGSLLSRRTSWKVYSEVVPEENRIGYIEVPWHGHSLPVSGAHLIARPIAEVMQNPNITIPTKNPYEKGRGIITSRR